MPAIVGFLSDFGLADPYAGTVKAVMLAVCPGLAIVDVSHGVAPQAVVQAVFLAQQSWPYFPAGSVQLAVVDPGVGTARGAIALRTPHGIAVGPDNGVLSAALPEQARVAAGGAADLTPRLLPVPPGCEVRAIESSSVIASRVSATFHGRDVFGPAAAHLAAGFPFEQIGPLRASMLVLPPFRGVRGTDGVRGEVVHVDRFGNLISTIHADDLPPGATRVLALGRVAPLVHTYADGTGDRATGGAAGLVALIGSSGYLELAAPNGSAAAALGAGVGLTLLIPAE